MAAEIVDGPGNQRGGYLFTYAQIVFNQVRRFAILMDPPKDYQGWMLFTQGAQIEAERRECRVLAIVITALFLEAYIYDYAARKESGSYAEKYLDKLDPVAKWVIVTRLFASPGIDRADAIFERLRMLFRLRNEFAHHKTKAGGSVWEAPDPPEEMSPVACMDLMCAMLDLLVKLDPSDEIAMFILRHVSSWVEYSSKDIRFYPIVWEA
jgi:hypothetical protein